MSKPELQKAEIIKYISETKDTHTLRLKLSKPFKWKPGQFAMVQAMINGESIRRAYSIASSPERDYLEITVRQTEAPTMSKYLNERAVGDILNVKGPYGRFIMDETRPVFCIAAGSGITPFRGMLEYCIDKNLDIPFKLLYSCRYGDNVIYEKELPELIKQYKHADYELSITRGKMGLDYVREGRINADYLKEQIPGFEKGKFYLCGAPGFINAMIDNLLSIGIPREEIKREQWG